MAIRLRSSGKLSVGLTFCGFDTFNLVSVNGASSEIKWSGKFNFQIVFILEQQVLLFHLKFLEVQMYELSYRTCIDAYDIFVCVDVHPYQFSGTHPSFKACVRYFLSNFYIIWWEIKIW